MLPYNFKISIYIKYVIIAVLYLNGSNVFAKTEQRYKEVEAIGRAVLIDGDIITSRKRALEDAIYIAALHGGADVGGFSAVKSNTIINDHSIVKATNRVIDFKILSEKQDKEFLTIKILAVVGNNLSKRNCTERKLNVTLLKGSYKVQSNVPSQLARYAPTWLNSIYESISEFTNVSSVNLRGRSINEIIKSTVNSSFSYNALTKGLPNIHPGDYSLVPEIVLTTENKNTNFSNYTLKILFNLFKGPNFDPISQKTYKIAIKHSIDSKFQFLKNISVLDIEKINNDVIEKIYNNANNFLQNIKCQPLEGIIKFNKGSLIVNLGKKQGLKLKQVGIVNGINIESSMLNSNSAILHTSKIFDNYSLLLPLNENIKLANLNNLTIEFME